jgi:DNA-binding transcriptional MerR regulator/methylmalonyl-CoA mutase cobalamin-binding subunit
MYTIKQAATRSGVPVDTIRAWERRYGVVAPPRTESGYRLYDEESIRYLDAMRRLVASGMQPNLAAAELREKGVDAAPTAAGRGDTAPDSVGQSGTADAFDDRDRLITRFVSGAAALDEREIATVVDEMFARGSFERATSDLLFPALKRLGRAWAIGEVSVAGEHLASHLVQRRLGQFLDASASTNTTRRRVIVGLAPGSRHELGALAFAVAARRAGIPVAYLGADLPIEDWVQAAKSARAAVVGVPTASDRTAAAEVVESLGTQLPQLVIAVGGNAAEELPGASLLPNRLDDAVTALRRTLAAR